MKFGSSTAALAAGAAVGIFAAAGAAAQDSGLYLSGGATYFNFDGDNGVDAEVNALSARAGLQFNEWLSIEGDAHFGFEDGDFDFEGDEDDFDLDDNSDGDVADIINAPGDFGLDYQVAAYARASLPLSDYFEVNGRAGYAFAEVSSTVTTPGGNDIELGDSESGPSYGVGATWNFTPNQALRVDYTYTDFDLATSSGLGLMYQFRF